MFDLVQIASPRRRGRPPAYDADAALQRAAEAFWKTGYAGTSLDDLSSATGMNRPSLYGAFGDKRAIYLKAIARYQQAARAAMRQVLDAEQPLRACLRTLYHGALAVYLSGESGPRGCFVVGTALTDASNDAEVRAVLADSVKALDAAFEARLRRAQAAGELRRGADPAALAKLASAVLHTLAVRARAQPDRKTLDALVESALDVLCA